MAQEQRPLMERATGTGRGRGRSVEELAIADGVMTEGEVSVDTTAALSMVDVGASEEVGAREGEPEVTGVDSAGGLADELGVSSVYAAEVGNVLVTCVDAALVEITCTASTGTVHEIILALCTVSLAGDSITVDQLSTTPWSILPRSLVVVLLYIGRISFWNIASRIVGSYRYGHNGCRCRHQGEEGKPEDHVAWKRYGVLSIRKMKLQMQ